MRPVLLAGAMNAGMALLGAAQAAKKMVDPGATIQRARVVTEWNEDTGVLRVRIVAGEAFHEFSIPEETIVAGGFAETLAKEIAVLAARIKETA